uniref:ATP-dependent Clp protease proteolytic subunit n=1 Tax=Medicago lupulina TaxID=47085 RepID=A0A0K0LWT7_9FABA|nr:clp protease proteolytic subunit [Medicago lupulina]AJE72541.1 ATP-dependent Clp protease proteolytic subunit [Medicago lupulina]QCO73663.1 clp protease proteolytic subunit [Medicago lupulina]UZA65609.1 clp protease proteolytic subunit [Medicago lupulina]
MPVGVPKVPFDLPEDEESTWADLYNRLYQQRFLFLGQEVESEISNQLVGLMVYLSLEDKSKDLFLFINSPGGEVFSGLAIFDIMRAVQADVQTVCVGTAASMASLILAGGEITKRLAFPHGRVMIHQPASSFYRLTADYGIDESDQIQLIRRDVANLYVEITGKKFWKIYKDMQRDTFMSAEDAQAHGIVDMVGD